jgi:hypothetical protein
VRVETNRALVVAHRQIRVMVFGIGYESHCIHETNGLVVVFEGEGFFQRAVDQASLLSCVTISVALRERRF